MGREPPSRKRRVALAGIHVDVSVGVFAVAVDDVLAVEYVVVLKWFVGSKAVGVDGERLLLAVGQQESNRRFVGGSRRTDVPLTAPTIYKNEHRWLVVFVCSTPTRG